MNHAFNQATHFLLWGKLAQGRTTKKPRDFHPLILHLIDVGKVAQAILERESSVVDRITFLNPLPFEDKKKLIAFLVAAHDVGKAAPAFQAKPSVKSHLAPLWDALKEHSHLGPAFKTFSEYASASMQSKCHGYLSIQALFKFFSGTTEPDKAKAQHPLLQFSKAVGFHHDRIPKKNEDTSNTQQNYPYVEDLEKGDAAWEELRQYLLEILWQHLVGSTKSVATFWSTLECHTTVEGDYWHTKLIIEQVLFAGLCTVADWVGSNEKCFPYEVKVPRIAALERWAQTLPDRPEFDVADYALQSAKRAEAALDGIVWNGQLLQTVTNIDFKEIFKFEKNHLQQTTADVASRLKGPFLVLIEGPMGDGKTEAAFSIVPVGRGIFAALPTQATGNQMFNRLRHFLEKLLAGKLDKTHLQLVHGNQQWHKAYAETEIASNFDITSVTEDEATRDTVVSTQWAANARTGLIAEFGVGTIDALLAAVLAARRHYFVRLFGIHGKTVIIDEVHAFDAYQDGLLSRLLGWLGHLECNVILLSATLPTAKRQAFLSAFADRDIEVSAKGYPRVTGLEKSGKASLIETLVPKDHHRIKKVRVRTLVIQRLADLARQVREDVQSQHNVGIFGIMCNNVALAQELYLLMQSEVGFAKQDLILHHAQFVLGQRMRHEENLLALCGKDRFATFHKKGVKRPLKIVIGTMVLEQSLDIDFDQLYTFPCPIDLFFQRLGRLHRRFYWFREETFAEHGLGTMVHFGEPANPDFSACKSQYVYGEYLLLRTLREIYSDLNAANDIHWNDREDLDQRVQKVYAAKQGELTDREQAALKVDRNNAAKEESFSRNSYLDLPSDVPTEIKNHRFSSRKKLASWFDRITKKRNQGNDNKVPALNKTRLGVDAVQVVLLVKKGDQLFAFDDHGDPNVSVSRLDPQDQDEARNLLNSSVKVPKREGTLKGCTAFKPYTHLTLRDSSYIVGTLKKGEVIFPKGFGLRYHPDLGLMPSNSQKEDVF